MTKILVSLFALVILLGVASNSYAQQGPCGPHEWQSLLEDWNQIVPSGDDYGENNDAISGFVNGILPAIGYGCQWEFAYTWEQNGAQYVENECGWGAGSYCTARAKVHFISQFLFLMVYFA